LFSYLNLLKLSPISQGIFGDNMSKNKWDKYLNQLKTEITELSEKEKDLQRRFRELKRLMSGKNTHLIRGEKYDRIKILWSGKDYWFHIPNHTESGKLEKVVDRIRTKFIGDILNGKIR